MDIKNLHQVFLKHGSVTTDTRNITPNGLFFALKGPHFNGNTFAKEALKKGAAYAIIDEEKYAMGNQTILVNNVLETLQKLGTYHRNQCHAKVISLTGSNGKTTTKELIYTVLSTAYKTIATQGNLNNHIGVPLTLLTIEDDTELAIIEMGANHKKEIEFLSHLAQPDFGYITNFGKAHLEGFGGVKGVIQGKSELYDYLMAKDKPIFFNADDPIQREKLASHTKKYGFSQKDHRYYTIPFLGADPYVALEFDNLQVKTNLIGEYNVHNCCAAILMGKYFNIDPKAIKAALESYLPKNNRSQVMQKNGHQIILDAYNANPTSMKAALESFKKTTGKNKRLFLGDMFELGTTSLEEHQNVADLIRELGFQDVHLVGDTFAKVNTKFLQYASFEALRTAVDLHSLPKSNILIKGSRGMAMERILDLL